MKQKCHTCKKKKPEEEFFQLIQRDPHYANICLLCWEAYCAEKYWDALEGKTDVQSS